MNGVMRIPVDLTNPGQFFACCGLFELAARKWPGATARFDDRQFEIVSVPNESTFSTLISELQSVGLRGEISPVEVSNSERLEAEKRRLKKLTGESLGVHDEAERVRLGKLLRAGAVIVPEPFQLRLDWWQIEGGTAPKTWAGSMQVLRVAQAAIVACDAAFMSESPFEYNCVLRPLLDDEGADEGGVDEENKAEPFYFDSVRGSNAAPIDIGFSPNKLKMQRAIAATTKAKLVKLETFSTPAVELLALIGLQRFCPRLTGKPRVYTYTAWCTPLPVSIAAAVMSGALLMANGRNFEFENKYRTDQRKHKGFMPATQIGEPT